jgi:hypothetical protein
VLFNFSCVFISLFHLKLIMILLQRFDGKLFPKKGVR